MIEYKVTSGDEYWEDIQKLLSSIHMTSKAPVGIGRKGPHIGHAYPGLISHHLTCCAFSEGQLVGFCRASLESYHISEKVEKMAYIGDHRVDPNFRGKRLAMELAEKLLEALHELGIRHGFYYVNAGNDAQERMMTRIQSVEYKRQSEFVTSSFLLPYNFSEKKDDYIHVTANENSTPPWLNTSHISEMSMLGSAQHWNDFLKRFPGVRLYAHRDEPAKILFALFDQGEFKEITMGSYEFKMKVLKGAWNLFRPLTGAAKFPEIKGPWKMADLCFKHPDLILNAEVLNFCKQEAFKQGCQVLNVITEINGKSLSKDSFSSSYSIKTYLNTWAFKPESPLTINDPKPFIDLAFV